MIISKIIAGLCNQIYFFSTAYVLSKEWGEELVLDVCVDGNPEWIYLLDAFCLPEIKKITYPSRYLFGTSYSRIEKSLLENAQVIDETYFEEIDGYYTIPKEKFRAEYPDKDIYLKGSFLTSQMFTKYIDDIRKIFVLKTPSPFVTQFEKEINGKTAIGVHIRRTGFVFTGQANQIDFFKAAIVQMRSKHKDAVFYIFSDEIEYAKECLGYAKDVRYVDAMGGYEGDIEEFLCLSKCDYYILSRMSSYGRMAEILNTKEDKYSLLFGDNKISDQRFQYLTTDDVNRLSSEYQYQKLEQNIRVEDLNGFEVGDLTKTMCSIGIDSGRISTSTKAHFMLLKAQMAYDDKEYLRARHLCYMLMNQKRQDYQYHKLYSDTLYKLHEDIEGMLECVAAVRLEGQEANLTAEDNNQLLRMIQSGNKHFVIVPYRHFTSQFMGRMMEIGLILYQMGNEVSFVLKRNEVCEYFPDLLEMQKWEQKLDIKHLEFAIDNGLYVMRFNTSCEVCEYEEIVSRKEIVEVIGQLSEKYRGKETIILGRDPICFQKGINARKVFFDFSDKNDDEFYLSHFISNNDMQFMYENADVIFTKNTEIPYQYSLKENTEIIMDTSEESCQAIWSYEEIPYQKICCFHKDNLERVFLLEEFCSR
jgi:thiol-disulfide isomerase/thioredoxin